MESIVIPELPLEDFLLSHVTHEALLASLTEQLRKIPNIMSFKLTSQMTKMVCVIVETAIKDNKQMKFNKKKLVVDILTHVFQLTPLEQAIVDKDIEFLLQHKLVTRILKPVITRAYRKLLKFTIGKN